MVASGYNVTPVDKTEVLSPETRNNCFLELIQRHYSVTPKVKTDEESNREKWLIQDCLLYNRWFSLPAAFLVQFCCGSLYAWSVFNKPIDQLMGTANVAPITFYVAIGCYGISAGISGPYVERQGPKVMCLTGITLVFIGNLLTALGLHLRLMPLVFVGYGGFVGAGFGICYITPVSTLQKWFPDKRGFGGGFATCGFGTGSIVLAKIQIPLINEVGLPGTFVLLGASFLILVIPSALVLRTPPNGYDPMIDFDTDSITKVSPELTVISAGGGNDRKLYDGTSLRKRTSVVVSDGDSVIIINGIESNSISPAPQSLLEAITSTDFRIMLIMFVGNIAFGIVVIARLANIVIDIFGKSPTEAANVVAVNGGVNFIGRLFFSILSDYIGRKYCYVVILSTQVIVLGLFSTMTNGQLFVPFWIAIAFASATYGAAFGVIPAYLTDKFGPMNISACHGIFISVWAATGVIGGLIFTVVFNYLVSSGYELTDSILYNVNVWWLLGVACTGWFTLFFVKSTPQDVKCKETISINKMK